MTIFVYMDQFHDNIRRERIKLGFSQGEIAEKMGVDRSTYNKFERGKTNLFTDNMHKFAEVVGKSEEEILLGDNPSGYLREGSLEDRMTELDSKVDLLSVQLEQVFSAVQKVLRLFPAKKD